MDNTLVAGGVAALVAIVFVAVVALGATYLKKAFSALDTKIGSSVESEKVVQLLLTMLTNFTPSLQAKFGDRYGAIYSAIIDGLNTIVKGDKLTYDAALGEASKMLDGSIKASGAAVTEGEEEFIKDHILAPLIGTFIAAPVSEVKTALMKLAITRPVA